MKPLEKMTKKELVALVEVLQVQAARGMYGAGVISIFPTCPTCQMQHPQGDGWSCSLTPAGWMVSYHAS